METWAQSSFPVHGHVVTKTQIWNWNVGLPISQVFALAFVASIQSCAPPPAGSDVNIIHAKKSEQDADTWVLRREVSPFN